MGEKITSKNESNVPQHLLQEQSFRVGAGSMTQCPMSYGGRNEYKYVRMVSYSMTAEQRKRERERANDDFRLSRVRWQRGNRPQKEDARRSVSLVIQL